MYVVSSTAFRQGRTARGKLQLLKELREELFCRHVLIVEGLSDNGITLSQLKKLIEEKNAESVEITALLSKPSRRKVHVDVKYVGFEIPDKFVVGYGMDFAEKLRGLPEICVLKAEMYKKQ